MQMKRCHVLLFGATQKLVNDFTKLNGVVHYEYVICNKSSFTELYVEFNNTQRTEALRTQLHTLYPGGLTVAFTTFGNDHGRMAAVAITRIRKLASRQAEYVSDNLGACAYDIIDRMREAEEKEAADAAAGSAAQSHRFDEKLEAAKAASLKDICERMVTEESAEERHGQVMAGQGALQLTVAGLQQTLSQRDAEKAALQQALDNTKTELAQKNTEHQQALAQKDAEHWQALDAVKAEQRQALAQKGAEIADLKTKNTVLETKDKSNSKLTNELSASKDEVGRQRHVLKNLNNQVREQISELTALKTENARLKAISSQKLDVQKVLDKLDLLGLAAKERHDALEPAAKERHDALELAAKGIMAGVQDTRDLVRLATRECHGEAMARLDELQRALAPPPFEHALDNDLGRSPKRARPNHHAASSDDGADDDDTQPLGGVPP